MGKLISKRLEQLEKDIELGVQSVGKALTEIHDTKAYKPEYDTFELYCKTRWGFSDRYARDLIDAESVRSKIGTLVPVLDMKTKHLVALSKVPPAKQAQVAASVIAEAQAEKRTPTEKDFREAAKPFITPKQEPKQETVAAEYTDVEDEPVKEVIKASSPQASAAPIQAVASRLDGIIKELAKLADEDGGQWLEFQTIEENAKNLKHLIRSGVYWVDCPECKLKGCKWCNNIGWLSRNRKQFLTQNQKDLLGL